MDSITRTAIKDEALRRGWKFEQFFNDETFYKITNKKGEWRLGRGSRLGFSDANGVVIARDKLRTYEFVESLGVKTVPYAEVKSHADALNFMKQHKVIVIKPRDSEQSQGVSVEIKNEQQLRRALHYAEPYASKGIVAQAQLHGSLYRVLVVGGQVVAAAERRPAFVVGDGVHAIDELIAIKNADPTRSDAIDTILKPIKRENAKTYLGETMLRNVPPASKSVTVDAVASVSRGSESQNVTHLLDAPLKEQLMTIARQLGLSVCGFDLMAPNVTDLTSSSFLPLLEINSMPGLRAHLFPTAGGEPINPAPFILDEAFSRTI